MSGMDAETERLLAKLIADGAAQLEDHAQSRGVTAFCRRPVQRERPNERFLQNTLRSVQNANRRADESEMWARRQQQLSRERDERESNRSQLNNVDSGVCGSKRRSERSPGLAEPQATSSSESTSSDQESERPPNSDGTGDGMNDEELNTLLSRHRRRGRGDVGPRAEDTGPFLEGTSVDYAVPVTRIPRGPTVPTWLRPQEPPATATVAASLVQQQAEQLMREFLASRHRSSQGKKKAEKSSKEKKSKKKKKTKKSKKHKSERASE